MEHAIPEGSLTYTRQGRGLEITQYHGLAGQVVIPEKLPWQAETNPKLHATEEDSTGMDLGSDAAEKVFPVRQIGKKAFLSKKYLRSVTIPASVESVGDWAFAYCDSLREVCFEGRDVSFGKAVFMECPKLRCIRFLDGTGEGVGTETVGKCEEAGAVAGKCEGVGALLAAAVTQMESPYLLDAKEAGSREWLGKWDARMLAILNAADDEGYSKQILCGEEDYESADLETYLRNSRKKKVRLLLLRLLWPMGLDAGVERRLKDYLLAHTVGCESDETWQVVREKYGDRREFYELFASLGCLTKENAPAVIAQAPEDHPEMKAFFLRWQAEHFETKSFFEDLEL